MTEDIDFVILYCDSTDIAWVNKKNSYLSSDKKIDVSDNRYRDWNNLRYWFRSVEKYAPWVRKIHFVSDHQVPDWLNVNHPKLNIVNHEDYISKEYLPLFNSCAIQLGINKIEGLSEKFVYFNDDMFLNDSIDKTYYFKNNLPCDTVYLTKNASNKSHYGKMVLSNYNLINKYFIYKNVIRKNFFLFFNPIYGTDFFKTVFRCFKKEINGIGITHLSMPYLKETWDTLWELEYSSFEKVYRNKFRDENDLFDFVFRFWRICKGQFVPKKNRGKFYDVTDTDIAKNVADAIKNKKYKELCINDGYNDNDNTEAVKIINDAFDIYLSEKSSFEK